MKKFLSLVLALIMTMSLVTVGAGAAYTDADNVNYDEAIDVMSKIGVISGYEDGSINPQGALTRGAAAKIICNLVLGPTDAAALAVTEAPYKDVPANSTFAGYIAYCKSAGYVSGYADGTFRPGATLTGYAFMKMLLGTLGLDKNIEGYEGTNWAINVAKRALNLGLDDDLNGSFNGTKGVNREEAMLFAFNALQTKTFTYENKGSSIDVGGVSITTGASKAKQDGNTLMKDLFGNDLKGVDDKDNFGRPATTWTYKNKKIGTYIDEADLVYSVEVDGKTLYNDLGLTASSATSFDYYNNNASNTGSISVTKGDEDTKVGGNGIILNVYRDSKDIANSIIEIDPYFAKVTAVAKDDDGTYILTALGDKMYTEDFAKNDYIVYTKTAKAGETEIQTAYAVEKKTGTVTKTVGTTKFYIDGELYETNESDNLSVVSGTVSAKDTVEFYVDEFGYLVYIKATSATASVDNVALMLEDGTSRGQAWAKMHFVGDKTAKVVDADQDYSNAYDNKLVKYTLDGDEYELEEVGHYYASSYSYAKGSATISIGGDNVAVNATTTFMFIDSDGVATYYTGIKNAPSFDSCSAAAYMCKDNNDANAAVLVLVIGADVKTNTSDWTFLLRNTSAKETNEGDGKVYYSYKTLTGATLDVDSTSAQAVYDSSTYKNGIAVVKSYTTNSKGVATLTMAPVGSYYRVDIISAVENGVVTLGTDVKAVADDCVVYMVNPDKDVSPSDVTSIVEQDYRGLYYGEIVATLNDDGEVDMIILSTKN